MARAIAMSSSEGLVRGMTVVDTGAPISVPVGEGAMAAASAPDALLIDCSTIDVATARDVAAKSGRAFVDAPVSGGQAGAENGQLTIMCGADDDAFYGLSQPVMAAYAKATALMGAS